MDFDDHQLTTLIHDISKDRQNAFMSGFLCSMFLSVCFGAGVVGFQVLDQQDKGEFLAPIQQPV